MTDWEKAMEWAGLWIPGQECKGCTIYLSYEAVEAWGYAPYHRQHDIPCPPPSPELGFRLLEAMKGSTRWMQTDQLWLVSGGNSFVYAHDPDLLTAISKTAAKRAAETPERN